MLAKPMKYASLARLTLSLVSCIWSSGSSCKSCTECPGLQNCSATPDVSERLFITFDIRQSVDCNSTNLIYLLQCKRCLRNKKTNCQYIGQTGRRIRDRLNEHRRDIINRRSDTSGVAEHFCRPGHSVQDLQLLPLLQMHDTRESVRRAKEAYFIGLANTLHYHQLHYHHQLH